MSLTGTGGGSTRAAIITQAKETAAAYYGTQCVSVELSNEESNRNDIYGGGAPEPIRTTIGFTASWTADIQHRWTKPTYGFPKCSNCQRTKG